MLGMLGEVFAAEPEGAAAPEVANFITLLHKMWAEVPFVEFLHHFEDIIFSWVIMLSLILIAYRATSLARREKKAVPDKLQNAVEMVVETLDNFICGVLGPRGRDYTPFIGTLFLYIFFMNVAGIVPGLKSPSASINTTLGLAASVFLYVQYTGIRKLGLRGYIDHLLGKPRWLFPLMLPLHLLEELIKPMSLSLRLFGNIFGEDTLIAAFLTLGIAAVSLIKSPIGLPFQFPFMILAILLGTIQALVFSLLSTIYILMMLPHEEEGHSGS